MSRLDDPASRRPVQGFVDGAPAWMAPILRHCARCGGELEYGPVHGEDRPRYRCADCGHVTYVNPRLVATALPITDDGRIVLIRRALPPGVGTWAQPGGFLEAEETVIQGAVRETMEETGLVVEPTGIVGVYPQPRARTTPKPTITSPKIRLNRPNKLARRRMASASGLPGSSMATRLARGPIAKS